MNRERLEASVVVPEEPKGNSDEAQIDIRHLCVLSLEVLPVVRPDQPVADPQLDQVKGF